MGISFIGLAFGILAVASIVFLICFCCYQKKRNATRAQPTEPSTAPAYPPRGAFQPPPPASGGPVGWNVSQPPGPYGQTGAPYPTDPMPGAPIGSAWGQGQPPYPAAPGAPPSYPSAPPPYPG